jgi:hypothetical protein
MRRQATAVQKLLEERVRQNMPEEKIKIVKRTGPKVSEIVKEIAMPWLDEARNTDQLKIVIGMAVLAWNMSLLPESERWEGMSPDFAAYLKPEIRTIIEDMVARKMTLFPDETRSILDYEFVAGAGGQLRLEVATTMSPKELAQLRTGETLSI